MTIALTPWNVFQHHLVPWSTCMARVGQRTWLQLFRKYLDCLRLLINPVCSVQGADDRWKASIVVDQPWLKVEGWMLPEVPPLITDILLSMDDRFLYFVNWLRGDLVQYDVRDPSRPRFVSRLWLGGVAHPGTSVKVILLTFWLVNYLNCLICMALWLSIFIPQERPDTTRARPQVQLLVCPRLRAIVQRLQRVLVQSYVHMTSTLPLPALVVSVRCQMIVCNVKLCRCR